VHALCGERRSIARANLARLLCDSLSAQKRMSGAACAWTSQLLTLLSSDILKRGLGLKEAEIGDIFDKWNSGVLDSFLIEM